MTTLTIQDTEAGLRLDALLAQHGLAPSVAAARRLLAADAVRIDGRSAKKGTHLRAGQVVEVSEISSPTLQPVAMALPVLYEDADLIAVAKPAGVPSHPLRPGEGASAAAAIAALFPECATASPDPREGGLVHRLDRGTTGVLIAARDRAAWDRLRQAMAADSCTKTYFSEVMGQFPVYAPGERDFVSPGREPGRFTVAVPIGRTGRHGKRVKLGGGRQPLPALTEVSLLEQRSETALVQAQLSKGRTHQVRAHLAYLGTPVVGDTTYGQAGETEESPSHLHLHAAAVTFVHPRTGQVVVIEAPPPAWAQRRR
jgi:23S rRNA pseudouridine1911/1915/1917 synthase